MIRRTLSRLSAGPVLSVLLWGAIVCAAASLSGCTAVTIADLAGRALSHPGVDTIDIRGGKLYESPDLRMRFRPVRELPPPPAPEFRDVPR